jgi:hypothetical protein
MSVTYGLRHGMMSDSEARRRLGTWGIAPDSIEHIVSTRGWH